MRFRFVRWLVDQAEHPSLFLFILLACLLIFVGGLLSNRAEADDDRRPASSLITFKIQDQFDQLHTDGRYRGRPLIVAWADRKGSDHFDTWDSTLTATFTRELDSYQLRLLKVAHVKGVPFFIKGKIKGSFQEKGAGPVLLDWDGAFDEAYVCVENHTNILLFDDESRYVTSFAVASLEPTGLAEVSAAVENLLP